MVIKLVALKFSFSQLSWQIGLLYFVYKLEWNDHHYHYVVCKRNVQNGGPTEEARMRAKYILETVVLQVINFLT